LTAQGKDAPGSAYSYLVKGQMIGGFAVVASPAEYRNSGVMMFMVNHDTASIAQRMKAYDPDSTWNAVQE
jgi:hypothetical protein